MENTMLKSLSLLGVSLMLTFSVMAQDVKVKEKDSKYKSEDVKLKEKTKDVKTEKKVKGPVKPMQRTSFQRTEIKTGETQVRTIEHPTPVNVEPALPEPEPVVTTQEAVSVNPMPEHKPAVAKHAVRKSMPHKAVATRKINRPRYIVRTKVVRDTVMVPSPPEKVVTTEYVHDTVNLTRVDTFTKVQIQNTYTGYRVPRGDFKKVTLKKDKNTGEVIMKRKGKEKDK